MLYNAEASQMGLHINKDKTVTMCTGPDVTFEIDGQPLKNIDHFQYLGSHLSADCQMNYTLKSRIQAASCAFGHLRERVFDSHDLSHLCQSFRIRWNGFVPNDDILMVAKVDDIEIVWMLCHLRWIGHIHRMTDDERPVKSHLLQ